MEQNNSILSKNGKKYNYLFDTSAILYFQTLYEHGGASIFKAIEECPNVEFYVINDVLSELMQGPKGINPTQTAPFLNHLLIAESAMDHNRKENRFIIKEGGELKFIVLNSISATDYAQVLVCQNHEELTLVSNDIKLLKSASQVLTGRRTTGIPALLDKLLFLYPNNKSLLTLKKTGDSIFVKRHAFGNISEKQFNDIKKNRKEKLHRVELTDTK